MARGWGRKSEVISHWANPESESLQAKWKIRAREDGYGDQRGSSVVEAE